MKRAKIVLSAVAIFAVVGGALAFKASRLDLPLFYKTTNQQGQQICSTKFGLTTTATTQNTVTLPVGATGWYTTDVCTGATTRAILTDN